MQNGATLISAADSVNLGDGLVAITYTVAADISVTPSSQDFGTWSTPGSETQPFQVTNSGEQPLNIGQASVTGADASQFDLPSGSAAPQTVALTGTAQTPADISVTPSPEDFGPVSDGQAAGRTLTVTDTGQAPLSIGQLTETGGEFTLVSGQDGCSQQTLSGGQTCTFAVSFAPSSPGTVSGSVRIASNAASAPSLVVGPVGNRAAAPAGVAV